MFPRRVPWVLVGILVGRGIDFKGRRHADHAWIGSPTGGTVRCVPI